MQRNINGEEALLPSVSSLNASHCTSARDRAVFVSPAGFCVKALNAALDTQKKKPRRLQTSEDHG